MRIKLDENLPLTLARILETLGHDVDTVASEGLTGAPDPDVWRAAQDDQRLLITQDLDFSDTRQFRPGTHHGLILVRLGTPSRRNLTQRVSAALAEGDVGHWQGCFVVITERKTRVRRP